MIKWILLGLVAALVVIQAIRPQLNVSTAPADKNDFIVAFAPPPEIKAILEHACYDCHSNNTRYPWYSRVQPVGWWLADHIAEGKRKLNFSEFGTYTLKKRSRALDHISDEVQHHEMPLKSYLWMHHDARLTEAQIQTFTAWIDTLNDRIAPLQ